MKKTTIFVSTTATVLALTAVLATPGATQVQGALPAYLRLQGVTPGTPQDGHANITGTMKAGQFVGGGAGITGVDAGQITTGVLGTGQLPSDVARKSQANTFFGTNQFTDFVGVHRGTPINQYEIFGLGAANAVNFCGMYVQTSTQGKPFYGYSIGGAVSAFTYLDGATGGWRLVNGGGPRLHVGSDGKVGIGTVDPFYEMEVAKKELVLASASGSPYVYMTSYNGGGTLETWGTNNGRTTYIGFQNGNNPVSGYLGAADQNGVLQAGMYSTTAGVGTLFADVKNFRVPNPRNAAEDIVYACVEGPEAAAYVRGTGHMVNGKATVDLPTHFIDVTVSQGMTVTLTPKSPESKGLGYWHGSNLGFDVFELNGGKGSYDFDWEVKCVRKGHEDYKVVRPWSETAGAKDMGQAWSARLRSISEAKARQTGGAAKP